MNRTKYLWFFCSIAIVSVLFIKILEETKFVPVVNQTQTIEPGSVSRAYPIVDVDPKNLIDDQDKVIPLESKSKVEVQKPYITAGSYLVANLVTGEYYIDFNSSKVFPIASVSKLYTALVVHHLFDFKKKITITTSMLDSYGDAGHLMLDEQYTPDELLHFLLMVSSNDAAEGFAQSFGESTSTTLFMTEMNGFAGEIGMRSTKFNDSSGLSPLNVSNVQDLFVLAKYLYTSEPDILKISNTQEIDFATTTEHGSHHLVNINPFSSYNEFIGGKTGRTSEARETMVSLFNEKVGGTIYPIAIIVLRSDLGEREINTEKLIGLFRDKFLKK